MSDSLELYFLMTCESCLVIYCIFVKSEIDSGDCIVIFDKYEKV